eukprot:11957620-Alexandrium_andersonii.AAC.1
MLPVCPMCRLPAPGDGDAGAEAAEGIEMPPEAGALPGEAPVPSPMEDEEAEEAEEPMEWDAPPPPLDPA